MSAALANRSRSIFPIGRPIYNGMKWSLPGRSLLLRPHQPGRQAAEARVVALALEAAAAGHGAAVALQQPTRREPREALEEMFHQIPMQWTLTIPLSDLAGGARVAALAALRPRRRRLLSPPR